MLNIREIIRRLLKYIILVIVVGLSAYIIPEKKIVTMDIVWIALISGMIFSILDTLTPSIKIYVEKK